MSTVELKVPDIGVEGEVEVIEVCVALGDSIVVDDPVVVLESDKATVEIPAAHDGTVTSLKVKVGDKVKLDDLLLTLEAKEEGLSVAEKPTALEQEPEIERPEAETPETKKKHDKQVVATTPNESLSDILVPDLGGADEAEVIEVLISEGDSIAFDQTIIVLESDKATMEIPSPTSGDLGRVLIKVGDRVSEGMLIASIRQNTQGNMQATTNLLPDKKLESAAEGARINTSKDVPIQGDATIHNHETPALVSKVGSSGSELVHAGPSIRKLARELGVDLSKVVGAGPKQRILKEDLHAYIKSQVIRAQSSPMNGPIGNAPDIKLPDFSAFGAVDVMAMDKMQKITASNMHASWSHIPHVTQFDQADITDLERFRKEQKMAGEARGVKLTPLAFLLKASAHALQSLPQFNVSLDVANGKIYRKKYIHIGVAVATSYGLVVPVIRDVNIKSLWDLAEECQLLAAKARDRKLSPAEMQGGCFTISSLGGIGGTAFTPIVNMPEVAILGVSKAETKPVYLNSEFVPRLMMPLSLSYDHRAINGADAAMFTTHLASVISDLRKLLL